MNFVCVPMFLKTSNKLRSKFALFLEKLGNVLYDVLYVLFHWLYTSFERTYIYTKYKSWELFATMRDLERTYIYIYI